ncbi:MAG: GAF domain-containing protein [Terriglobales bacterium]
MSPLLPIKQSSRAQIIEIARVLRPSLPDMTLAWRRKMAEEFAFDERVLAVLEKLNIATGCRFFLADDFNGFFENLTYYGTRLAKLQVDTRAVARSLEFSLALCEPYLSSLGEERQAEARAALEMVSSAAFVTVSGAYFDTQKRESGALLALLDAELSALNLQALLQRVLETTTAAFNATLGLVLLRDPENDLLHVEAHYGFDEVFDKELSINLGQGFSGRIAQTGEPDILPDLAHSNGVLNPYLRARARSLWGVPLKHGEKVIGVLLIGFGRPYEWLPTERELMRAIADRSALAIDRARITDALREREARIAELSGHLLKAQEDERKRISRELHDETGQALMVIRLYLGMLESTLSGRSAKSKVRETVSVVDRTIEGIRRIIGRLSPLLLQELGLVAAIRKEAKDLAKGTGVKARVAISENVGRLGPDIEAALYRVVQEALHNVAKHAQAKLVNIQMTRINGSVQLLVEDDGVGMSLARSSARAGQTFGLAGMRERLAILGGTLRVTSSKGHGTRLEITVPAEPAGMESLRLAMHAEGVASGSSPSSGRVH